MHGPRAFLLILLATVLAVGGPLRALPRHAGSATPSCHEMTGPAHRKAPAHKPKPDALALNCCAGCLPVALRDLAAATTPHATVRIAFVSRDQAAEGLSPTPDHGPPRSLT